MYCYRLSAQHVKALEEMTNNIIQQFPKYLQHGHQAIKFNFYSSRAAKTWTKHKKLRHTHMY